MLPAIHLLLQSTSTRGTFLWNIPWSNISQNQKRSSVILLTLNKFLPAGQLIVQIIGSSIWVQSCPTSWLTSLMVILILNKKKRQGKQSVVNFTRKSSKNKKLYNLCTHSFQIFNWHYSFPVVWSISWTVFLFPNRFTESVILNQIWNITLFLCQW